MKRIKLLLLITLLTFFNSCNAQKANDIDVIFSLSKNLEVRTGIRNGDELKFYDNKDKTIKEVIEKKFNLPDGTNQVIMIGTLLGVRIGSELKFYKEKDNDFYPFPEMKFDLPIGTDEIAMANGTGILAVRIGSELRFYKKDDYSWEKINTEDEYKLKELPEMKFNLPDIADEIAMIGTAIFVRNGSELKIYNAKDKTFKELPEKKFTLPNGADEIAITMFGMLAVRNGSELRFYDINKNFQELPKMKFNLPKN